MISLTSVHNPPHNLLRRLLLLPAFLVFILTASGSLHAGITRLSEADRQHLLEDNFQMVYQVADIPPGVRQAFAENAKVPFHMADPGRPFLISCIVTDPELPVRRLVFAGISPDYCFIHYELGGINYGWHVVLFRLAGNGKANFIWGATCGQAFPSLEQLRKGLQAQQLHDSGDYRW